jgi:hypothetical protein
MLSVSVGEELPKYGFSKDENREWWLIFVRSTRIASLVHWNVSCALVSPDFYDTFQL